MAQTITGGAYLVGTESGGARWVDAEGRPLTSEQAAAAEQAHQQNAALAAQQEQARIALEAQRNPTAQAIAAAMSPAKSSKKATEDK